MHAICCEALSVADTSARAHTSGDLRSETYSLLCAFVGCDPFAAVSRWQTWSTLNWIQYSLQSDAEIQTRPQLYLDDCCSESDGISTYGVRHACWKRERLPPSHQQEPADILPQSTAHLDVSVHYDCGQQREEAHRPLELCYTSTWTLHAR